MRNLKRALSLALAAIMLIGMMVVSASATGLDDFSDKDESRQQGRRFHAHYSGRDQRQGRRVLL